MGAGALGADNQHGKETSLFEWMLPKGHLDMVVGSADRAEHPPQPGAKPKRELTSRRAVGFLFALFIAYFC